VCENLVVVVVLRREGRGDLHWQRGHIYIFTDRSRRRTFASGSLASRSLANRNHTPSRSPVCVIICAVPPFRVALPHHLWVAMGTKTWVLLQPRSQAGKEEPCEEPHLRDYQCRSAVLCRTPTPSFGRDGNQTMGVSPTPLSSAQRRALWSPGPQGSEALSICPHVLWSFWWRGAELGHPVTRMAYSGIGMICCPVPTVFPFPQQMWSHNRTHEK